MVVTEDRVDQAMQYLAQTDLEVAHWKGATMRAEYMAEVAESLAYKSLEGTVEDRKRGAKCDENVKAAMEDWFKAIVEFEKIKARRAREVLVIDLYRTMEASRRAGHLQ